MLKKYYRFHEKVVSFSKRPTIVIFFPISGFFREDIIWFVKYNERIKKVGWKKFQPTLWFVFIVVYFYLFVMLHDNNLLTIMDVNTLL